MRPVVFSASSVNAYLDCHLRWWFTYVLAKEGEQSEAQRIGVELHDWVETRLKGWHAGVDSFDHAPLEIRPLTAVFERDILPTYRNPVWVEQEFQIEVDGIPFSGIIDSMDEQDTPWGFEDILRDLKSTGSRPKAGKYRFNMVGYWLGGRDLGREAAAIQLDYIVRTKEPYYWPEVQPIPDESDQAIFANTLYQVANSIDRSDYRPTGLGTRACLSCPHAAMCGPYKRYKELTDAD